MSRTTRCRIILGTLTLSASLGASAVEFNIPPQSLDSALLAFAEQAQVQVSVAAAGISGVKTEGISGDRSPEDALTHLLKDTGLTFTAIGKRTYSVTQDSPKTERTSAAREPSVSMRLAQADGTQGTSSATSLEELQEVVVTSRKRSENVMSVPSGVTVVGDDFIKANNANSLTDLGYGMTGVLLDSGNGGSQFVNVSVRGVSGLAELTGVRSGVGFFVDGVNVFNQTAFNVPLLDVERIEVLKGPQPAAFGRSAVGGAINMISRKPSRELSFDGDLTFGNYDLSQARLTVGGPVVADKLFVSVSGLTMKHDGYVKNLLEKGLDPQSADVMMGKLNVLYQASDALSLQFIQDYVKDDGFYGPRDCQFAGCAPGGAFDRKILSANGKYRDTSYSYRRSQLNIDYTLAGGGSIQGITGYHYNTAAQQFDITDLGQGSEFADYTDHGSWDLSQELRYVSPDSGAFKYVTGVLYTREDLDFSIPFINPADAPVPLFPDLTEDLILDDRMVKKTDVYSVFASGNYALTERLKLDVGARFSHEKTTARSIQSVIADAGLGEQGAADKFFGIELFDVSRSGSWNNFEGQVALSYNFTPNAMVYGRVSQGKKSGGFTQLILFGSSARRDPGFGPETLRDYELGAKAEWLDRKLRLMASLHQSDYDDIQVRFASVENQGIRIIQNASAARSKGAELEVSILPNEHFSVVSGISLNKPEFTVAVPVLSIQRGNLLPFTPKVIADITLSADYPLSGNVSWFGGTTVGYRSKSYFDSSNTFSQDAHTVVNATTGLKFMDGRLTTSLWARNLTDKTVTTFAFFPGSERYLLNAPRTYGLEVGFKY